MDDAEFWRPVARAGPEAARDAAGIPDLPGRLRTAPAAVAADDSADVARG